MNDLFSSAEDKGGDAARPWVCFTGPRRRVLLALAGAAIVLAIVGCTAALMKQGTTYETHRLEQGWSTADRQAYYHTAQGTEIMPYAWFLYLEKAGSTEWFRSNENIAGYGLLPDRNLLNNPDGLPVGVTRDVDGETGRAFFGLTCAACHTGQINYQGASVRIDGGSGPLDLTSFVKDMFLALGVTWLDSEKFDRFARNVLAGGYTEDAKAALHKQVGEQLKLVIHDDVVAERLHLYPVREGFGRQDALGRGGNNGFSKLNIDSDLQVADAPVSYPAVWDAIGWNWVQYNASIRQPLGRNIGEVLGVGGIAVLHGDKKDLYKSTVNILALDQIETLLHKLKAPAWPEDVLGPIDQEKALRGRALFQEYCFRCHGARVDKATGNYLVRVIPLDLIGTDPRQALNIAKHMIDPGDLREPGDKDRIPATEALRRITENVAQRKFRELGVPQDVQDRMRAGKPNDWGYHYDDGKPGPVGYRAHLLTAIWATPPYLHNGSVRNMYELLSPAEERSATFYTGNLEYDPVRMGYRSEAYEGAFLFDSALPGNSNAGHEFRTAPPHTGGVIGRTLTSDERFELIEYLKTRETSYP
jgi:mono/diheme cytochrome c family protein